MWLEEEGFEMKIYTPANFGDYKWMIDKKLQHNAQYLLHTIYINRLFNFSKKEKEVDPYVNLKSDYLKKIEK